MIPLRQLTCRFVVFDSAFAVAASFVVWRGARRIHHHDGSQTGKTLRPAAPAFHYVQLLSAAPFSAQRSQTGLASQNSALGAGKISVLAGRLRDYARTHSSADFRAEDRLARHGDAGVQATRLASTKGERPTTNQRECETRFGGSSATVVVERLPFLPVRGEECVPAGSPTY